MMHNGIHLGCQSESWCWWRCTSLFSAIFCMVGVKPACSPCRSCFVGQQRTSNENTSEIYTLKRKINETPFLFRHCFVRHDNLPNRRKSKDSRENGSVATSSSIDEAISSFTNKYTDKKIDQLSTQATEVSNFTNPVGLFYPPVLTQLNARSLGRLSERMSTRL
jgi:hypothetical protein